VKELDEIYDNYEIAKRSYLKR